MRLLFQLVLLAVLMPFAGPQAQAPSTAAPLRLVSPSAKRSLTTTTIGAGEFVSLSELATFFRLTVTDDPRARSLTVTTRGKTAVAAPDQARVTVDGRPVTLSARMTRTGDRWLVPIDFIPRVVGPLIGQRVDLRDSRFVVVGTARVPRVTSRVQVSATGTRVVIDISPAATVATVVEARRVLVRVEADALDTNPTPGGGPLPAGGVEQIGQGDQPTAIAVILGPSAGRARVSATAVDRVMRVTVDVPPDERPTPEPAPAQSAAPPAPPVAPVPPPAPAAAAPAVDPVLPPAASPRSRLPVIAIDPGHGGTDVGVRRGDGRTEKDLTLAVARRLKARLEQQLPVRVLLTREDDSAVDLDTRAALANGARAELLLSLHAGSAPSPAGFTVLFHDGGPDEQPRREGAPAGATLPLAAGGSRAIAFVPWQAAQADHADAAAMLATAVDEALRRHALGGPRPPRRAPLRLLAGVTAPAVLVEIGWPDGPGTRRDEAADSYDGDVANALADGLVQYRQRRDERRGR